MSLDDPNFDTLHILSVRSPWWWWIIHGPKDIENRPRASKFKGPVAIQVSRTPLTYEDLKRDHDAALEMFVKGRYEPFENEVPKPYDFLKHPHAGCIVGVVEMTGYTRASDSVWFRGPVGLMLRNPRALPEPIPCIGRLFLFQAPRHIRAAVRDQLVRQ